MGCAPTPSGGFERIEQSPADKLDLESSWPTRLQAAVKEFSRAEKKLLRVNGWSVQEAAREYVKAGNEVARLIHEPQHHSKIPPALQPFFDCPELAAKEESDG